MMNALQAGVPAARCSWRSDLKALEATMDEGGARDLEFAIDAVIDEINRQDRTRNIHYQTLKFCTEPRRAEDVESFIAELPEMRHSIQEPYIYMDALIDVGGLSSTALDSEGVPVDMEVFDAATDEERETMIADYELATTQAGLFALRALAPVERMRAKLGEKPERYSTYLAVLDFCREPRTLADVQRMFEEDSTLNRETTVDRQPLACDFYLSELERAGGIVWDGGWKLTSNGRAFLESAAD